MFVSPIQLVESLALRRGDIVADFGSGAGAYVFPVSRLVGDRGKVYAIDKDKNILDKINREADKLNLINIDTILTDIEEKVAIDSFSCDAVILSNILSEISNHEFLFKEVKRILKPDGIILIVDWKNTEHNLSMKRENIFSEEELFPILKDNKFYIKKHFPAGNYHYAILVMHI